MNAFDKKLDRLELTYAQTQIIKQAVDKLIIGDDVPNITHELDALGVPHKLDAKLTTAYALAKNTTKAEQRKALWGDKS